MNWSPLNDEPSTPQEALFSMVSILSLVIGWWLIRYGRGWQWQVLGGLLVALPFLLIPFFTS